MAKRTLEDALEPARKLAAEKPPPRARNALAETIERAATPYVPHRDTINKLRGIIKGHAEALIDHEHACPRWTGERGERYMADGDKHYIFDQFRARGFVFTGRDNGRYFITTCEPEPSIPSPDLPEALTVAAHREAVREWELRKIKHYVKKFCKRAYYKDCGGLINVFDRGVLGLIDEINENLRKYPFRPEFSERRCVVVVQHRQRSPMYDGPWREYICAHLEDVPFEQL